MWCLTLRYCFYPNSLLPAMKDHWHCLLWFGLYSILLCLGVCELVVSCAQSVCYMSIYRYSTIVIIIIITTTTIIWQHNNKVNRLTLEFRLEFLVDHLNRVSLQFFFFFGVVIVLHCVNAYMKFFLLLFISRRIICCVIQITDILGVIVGLHDYLEKHEYELV